MTNLNMTFHMVVSVYRLLKFETRPSSLRNSEMANITEWTNSGAMLEARLIGVSKQRALSGIHCGLADTSLAIRDILALDQAPRWGKRQK